MRNSSSLDWLRFMHTPNDYRVSPDFPIRDHKVILLLRRRKWVDIRTGKSFILPLKIAAEGTRYSKEFAAFLKETYGHIPGDLPYA